MLRRPGGLRGLEQESPAAAGDGWLVPLVDEPFPLREAAAAHTALVARDRRQGRPRPVAVDRRPSLVSPDRPGDRMPLDVTFHIDPSCPFGYSATPDLTALRWRYGSGLRWRAVMIGLSEAGEPSKMPGFTPTKAAQGAATFSRRYGMPVGAAPRDRKPTSGRACRALVAVRRHQPDRFWDALRALQFGWFCSERSLDEDAGLREALAAVPGLDVDVVVAAIDAPETETAYQQDRAETRSAAGSPTEAQGKTSGSGDEVRYSAPSLRFAAADGRRLEAGGFQSLAVYDVLVANLDPSLPRTAPPEDAHEALVAFGHGLTTQEVAAILAPALAEPDRADAESRLLALAGEGRAHRTALGNDALWTAAR